MLLYRTDKQYLDHTQNVLYLVKGHLRGRTLIVIDTYDYWRSDTTARVKPRKGKKFVVQNLVSNMI